MIRVLEAKIIHAFIRIFWFIPINNKRILFISFSGLQYSDSPKSISDYLLKNYPEYEQVWSVNSPEKYSVKGIKFIKTGTLNYIYHNWTAKCIITNNGTSTFIPYRKSQVILDTWHGGGTGKLTGLAKDNPSKYDKYFFEYHNKKTTAYVSSSENWSSNLLEKSFHFDGEVLKTGLPRNAFLFIYDEKDVLRIKKKLSVSKELGVILYAPTFRTNNDNCEQETIDVGLVLDSCKERFGKEFVFLYRGHHASSIHLTSSRCIDITNYSDMQELIAVCDLLISDYSSCYWDAAIIHKPAFIYATDLNQYEAETNFYLDIRKWPYPLATNNTELIDNIKNYDFDKYKYDVDNYLEELNSYESEESVIQVSKWVINRIEK